VPRFQPRVSGVTLLAAAVLVLLPALAWLQYSWLDQIADADRERRERTLQTAASQLAQDFDGELGKAVFGLQLEPSIVEQQAWTSYAARYLLWADSALTPDLVSAVYFVGAPAARPQAAQPPLRVWNQGTQTFDEIPWPAELAAVRSRFLHDSHTVINLQAGPRRRGELGGQRMLLPPAPTGDEQSIVVPIVRITTGAASDPGPPDVKLLGFTIIRLNLIALGNEVLPTLVRRHLFDNAGRTDFLIAVVARDQPSRVIFESEPGAATAATETPDAVVSMLGTRMGPFMFTTRDARRGGPGVIRRDVPGTGAPQMAAPGPPPPLAPIENSEKVVVSVIEARRGDGAATVQTRGFAGGGEGHWRLVAKHRAGSLEAAVNSARTRNFVLSSGILLLLATAIGLIVVSARRADRLARQQLEFVAAVSHELRTPVSVIGAAAGNLADGVVEEAGRVKKYGVTIQTEARRLAETVERVLQLAGIASGRATAAGGSIAVADLIRDAVAASRHEIDDAGARLEVEIAPELLDYPTDPSGVQRVAGDAAALRSAIHNLISNAIKYGGEARWVRVSARSTSHRATQITVEDRGLGIAAEDRKHIFEPFYRGREAVSRQIQGSGLGLHLVRRIIEAHGGTVSVHSEPGHGSTFTIELPALHDVPTRRTSGRPSAFARIFGGRRTLGADGPAG
jgi:signal transduction histidine kinase